MYVCQGVNSGYCFLGNFSKCFWMSYFSNQKKKLMLLQDNKSKSNSWVDGLKLAFGGRGVALTNSEPGVQEHAFVHGPKPLTSGSHPWCSPLSHLSYVEIWGYVENVVLRGSPVTPGLRALEATELFSHKNDDVSMFRDILYIFDYFSCWE